MSTKQEPKTAKTWMTPEMIERIRDAALEAGPDYLQDRDETLVVVLADTGLRVSELVALRWDFLELGEAELLLPGPVQKGNPDLAYIDLAPETVRQLRRFRKTRYKDSEHLFFSRQSDQMTTASVRNLITKLAKHAGVRPHAVDDLKEHEVEDGRAPPEAVSPHTFRHSIAYRLIRREDKRLEDVQLRLRHSSLRTTDQVYTHLRRR